MARKLRFNTYRSSEQLEPIEVTIGPEDKEKVFHFKPMVLGIHLLDMFDGFSGEDDIAAIGVIRTFLSNSVTEDDHDRFFKCLGDPDMFVGPDTLIDIAMSLAEEYMGSEVPTEPASSSSNGSAGTGSGSKAASPKKAAPASRRSTRAKS